MDYTSILKVPVSTEKAVRGSAEGHHVFYVGATVNKIQVSQAIKALYGISPLKVRIVNLPSKTTGQGRIKRSPRKKAIVILKKGQKLDPSKLKA